MSQEEQHISPLKMMESIFDGMFQTQKKAVIDANRCWKKFHQPHFQVSPAFPSKFPKNSLA